MHTTGVSQITSQATRISLWPSFGATQIDSLCQQHKLTVCAATQIGLDDGLLITFTSTHADIVINYLPLHTTGTSQIILESVYSHSSATQIDSLCLSNWWLRNSNWWNGLHATDDWLPITFSSTCADIELSTTIVVVHTTGSQIILESVYGHSLVLPKLTVCTSQIGSLCNSNWWTGLHATDHRLLIAFSSTHVLRKSCT